MSRYRTRVIELAEPRARKAARNDGTAHVEWSSEAPISFHELFLAHYPRIRETCVDFAEPGLAVFAISAHAGWVATMCLASRAGELRAGLVGRHSQADLFLDDPCIALRHLIFLVDPPRSLRDALNGEVRFRVLDLNTANPPTDEEGRAVESLTAEGPVFLNCQGLALMAFVTGDPSDWPDSGEDAWAHLPDRVFVEERLVPVAGGSEALPHRGGHAPRRVPVEPRRITVVRRDSGPADVAIRQDCGEEAVCGQLLIRSLEKIETLRIGRESLRRGLLAGRYDRCDAAGRTSIEDQVVSRVHVLVIEAVGRPYAIDLASTNGTYLYLEASESLARLRVAPLGDGDVIALGSINTCLTWVSAEVFESASNEVALSEDSPPPVAPRPPAVAPPKRAPDPPPSPRTPTEFLRQLPRYLEASPLEREVWESYYIPLALALLERGGSLAPDDAARLVPFPEGRLGIIAGAMNSDGLGIFNRDQTSRFFSLRVDVCDILKELLRTS